MNNDFLNELIILTIPLVFESRKIMGLRFCKEKNTVFQKPIFPLY